MEMSARQQGFKKTDIFADEKKVEVERLIGKGVFNLKACVITDEVGTLEGEETELRVKGTGQVNCYPEQKEHHYLWYWRVG